MDGYLKYYLVIGGAVAAFKFGLDAGDRHPFAALFPGLLWFVLVTLAVGVVHGLLLVLWRAAKWTFRRAAPSRLPRGTR